MKDKKAHGLQLLIRCVVRDPDGKIISDTGEKPSKSFVIQFLEFFWIIFRAPGGYVSITTITGAEGYVYRDIDAPDSHLRVDASAGQALWGIVLGTGDTAETNTDYKLQTQLTEGVGAGNISHGVTTIGEVAVVGPNVDLLVRRSFTNLTGSAIVLKETGIYFRDIGRNTSFLMSRDVFPGPVNVPDNCSLTLFYTFRTTV